MLNPDLEVRPGSLEALLSVIRSGTADLVVPRLVDADGKTQPSLYREPSAGTLLGDAAFGARWPQRPAALAGTDRAPESYQFGHEIDWATGAAVMVGTAAAQHIGAWDEQFFLYSEETDYFRRARELGFVARYEPRAMMVHLGSGSGTRAPAIPAAAAAGRACGCKPVTTQGKATAGRSGTSRTRGRLLPHPSARRSGLGALRVRTGDLEGEALGAQPLYQGVAHGGCRGEHAGPSGK